MAQLRSVHELDAVLQQAAAADVRLAEGWQKQVQTLGNTDRSWTASVKAGVPFAPPDAVPSGVVWLLSTAEVPGMMVGQAVDQGAELLPRPGFQLPYRLIGVEPEGFINPSKVAKVVASEDSEIKPFLERPGQSLEQLGILEGDHLVLEERFPEVRGKGQLDEALAVSEMVALQQQVPFRRDAISKVLEAQFRRNKTLSIELLASLLELLGLNCQLAIVDTQHLLSVEAPAVFLLEGGSGCDVCPHWDYFGARSSAPRSHT